MKPLAVYIGYDTREPIAYHVLCSSIMRHTTVPVSITPLTQDVLRRAGCYTRERGPTESTEFSITRFLVPYLSGFRGYSLFMDCDMLCRSDLTEIWAYALAEPGRAVYCCQHDYEPTSSIKFLGQVQTRYPRKNWSSLMLFDNDLCRALTPAYVNQATGLELHRLHWASGPIGALPLEFNWLVGEYPENPDAKILHYTLGGPWFAETIGCDHAQDWYGAVLQMFAPMPHITEFLMQPTSGVQ